MSEPTNIGLSDTSHNKLKRLKEDGHFGEMLDGYRCAIALALACGVEPEELDNSRTVFGVASVDPDKELYSAIKAIMPDLDIPVYRMAERLADWGVVELSARSEKGAIDFVEMLESAEG